MEKAVKLQEEMQADSKALVKLEKKGRELQLIEVAEIEGALKNIDARDEEALGYVRKRLDQAEPKVLKWKTEVDKMQERERIIWEYLEKLKRLTEKEREKVASDEKNKALGDAASFAQEFVRKQKQLEEEMAGHWRLWRAMTGHPDYQASQGRVEKEKQKLEALGERLEELVSENEELSERIGPMLRGEIKCEPAELEERIAAMREKMDEDHNEINDFDEELEAMRGREQDAGVPAHLHTRDREMAHWDQQLQIFRDRRRALADKLKHQEEFCDMPGELDDLIRQQVREDLKRIDNSIAAAETAGIHARDTLSGLHHAVAPLNLF